MSTTNFYRAFEERYRGSRELIAGRLGAYLPFVLPLLDVYKPAATVDLGCGRGEWLELLTQRGFEASGVDLDAGMLAACTERGLRVVQQDALDCLKSLPDESQTIVSGFHIVEHIPFDVSEAIVRQAMRVLKPGGLLILETPNPENLVVGTSSFYLDPTHIRPIPPMLLSFLPEHYGFARVRTLRLQEEHGLLGRAEITLMDVLGGVSPDYSVVAQKAAASEVMAKFDASFTARHGIELHEIAGRFDQKIDQRMSALDERLTRAESQYAAIDDKLDRVGTLQDRLIDTTAQLAGLQTELLHAEAKIKHTDALTREQRHRAEAAEAKLQSLQMRVDELGQSNHQWWMQANQLEAERDAMRESLSWRITAPLRFAAGVALQPGVALRTNANRALYRAIEVGQRPLARLMAVVLRKPFVAQRINTWLMRFPPLYQHLLSVAQRQGVVPGLLLQRASHLAEKPVRQTLVPDLAHLTPRARQIYADLKQSIENNKRRG